jgi:hypothetical protein
MSHDYPFTAEQLRYAHTEGVANDWLEVEAREGLRYWQAEADRLAADHEAREAKGAKVLAHEARALKRARGNAYDLAVLLDDLLPQYRHPMVD